MPFRSHYKLGCLCRQCRDDTVARVSNWATRTFGPRDKTGSGWHVHFGVFRVPCTCEERARELFECDCKLYLTDDGRYARSYRNNLHELHFWNHYRTMHNEGRPQRDRWGHLKWHECDRANHSYFRHFLKLYLQDFRDEKRYIQWQESERRDLRLAQNALRQVRRLLSKPRAQEA